MLASDVIERAEKRVGQTLKDKWHLDRVIGVGGMAAVYEATHRNRNRVAIKLLHPEMSLDAGTRARFLREGYVANTIRHPGAVQVLDDDISQDGAAFLVMELLHGESLEERMMRKGGTLEAGEALLLIEQLLEILAAAHDQGVIHRDIKPDNLFLTRDGVLKVLDFGIARLHQSDSQATRVGSFMGTPAFCAPEQARGRWTEVDARTDLYSVGATLFTVLTGAHVHEAETSSEQLALAISASARSLRALWPEAPDDLVDLVDTALAYDKEERFQTARAMRAAVQRVAAGLPTAKKVSTPPDSAPSRPALPPLSPSGSSVPVRMVWMALVAFVLAAVLFGVAQFKKGGAGVTADASGPTDALTTRTNATTMAPSGGAALGESTPRPEVPATTPLGEAPPVGAAKAASTVKAVPKVTPVPERTLNSAPPAPASTVSAPASGTADGKDDDLFGKRY